MEEHERATALESPADAFFDLVIDLGGQAGRSDEPLERAAGVSRPRPTRLLRRAAAAPTSARPLPGGAPSADGATSRARSGPYRPARP
jgi:hypothetical protein